MNAAIDHLRDGRLHDAVVASASALRVRPDGIPARLLYAELLCIKGDLERADGQLAAVEGLAPGRAAEVGAWRGLVRAAQARLDVFERGAVPELVAEPGERISGLLHALMDLRRGAAAEAAKRYRELESTRPARPATIDGAPVADVRELDDRMAGVFELLTSGGQYLWIEQERLRSLEFMPRRRPLDGLWRRARITVADGPQGEVFIPLVYPTATTDEDCLLGRCSEWIRTGEVVAGVGHRLWLIGDDARPLGELEGIAGSDEAGAPTPADASGRGVNA